MPVVSDADVLIHLAKLDLLHLLEGLYGEVLVPVYVKDELVHSPISAESKRIKKALEGIIRTCEVRKVDAKELAEAYNIHRGEANVKALAEDVKADLFLSNERKVRAVAKSEGFKVAGTIGIIIKGVEKELLKTSDGRELLKKMKKEEIFRIHPDLINEAIDHVNRKRVSK